MTRPKLIVFDVDGTLVDSQNIIVETMARAFAGEGLEPPRREAILGIVGLSLEEAMAALVPEAGPQVAGRLAAGYRGGFVAARAAGVEVPLYPGAKACLEALRGRPEAVLGVATGKARRGVDHTIDTHGLHGYFTTIQTADGHPSKPHPSMLLAAMAETGIAPGDAVMIGDTSYDMEMGRAADMACIGVDWGYHPRERLEAAGPDRIVGDFEGLMAAIGDWAHA